jgi:hypothetical protein
MVVDLPEVRGQLWRSAKAEAMTDALIDALCSLLGFALLGAIVWVALSLERCGATSLMMLVCAP